MYLCSDAFSKENKTKQKSSVKKVHFVPPAKGEKQNLSHEGGKRGHVGVAYLHILRFEVISVSL